MLKLLKKDLKLEMLEFDSKNTAAKMLEGFCESGPQFVLQLSIMIRANSNGLSLYDILKYFWKNPGFASIKMSTLITSFASLIVVAFGVLVGLIAVADIDAIASDLADECKIWIHEMNKADEKNKNGANNFLVFDNSTS